MASNGLNLNDLVVVACPGLCQPLSHGDRDSAEPGPATQAGSETRSHGG